MQPEEKPVINRYQVFYSIKLIFMKRTIFGFIAISLAIVFSAFTTVNKSANFATKYFAYAGPNYTEANVENPANWVYIASQDPICNNTNTKACQIEINTTLVNPDNTLMSGVVIVSAGSSSVYYVTSGGDVTSRRNKN